MALPSPFGKYLLLERISVGGMAEVFKAKTFGVEGFEKIIAIKKILPAMAEDADFIQMFIDEAKIAGQLNHANICQIFELGKIEDSHFIAMEYIWGKDLLQIQNRFRRLKKHMPIQMAAFVLGKVCEGLDYAHRKKDATGKPLNIIHRDVSPQNVILSYDGEVKVIDFGIAKAASRSSKTQAGVLKGKFGYMSPEQVGGKTLDQRTDLFAVGTILYEMLTSDRLFVGESDFVTLEKIRNANVPPPSTINSDIPKELDRIIMKALARDPGERYQWGSEMHDDLADFSALVEPVFNAKSLATWMREAFVQEMRKEAAVLDQQRKIGKEAMSQSGPQKAGALPSARLRSPTLAPNSSAPRAMPTDAPEPTSALSEAEIEPLGDGEGEAPGQEGDLLNQATAIVQPDQVPGGQETDLPNQATAIFDGAKHGGEEDPNDIKAQSTAIFDPSSHRGAQNAQPQQPAPPPPDPYGGMNPQYPQNPSMVGPMGAFPSAYGSAVMPAMAMPFASASMSAIQPGAMVLLPNGTVIPAAAIQQVPPPPQPAAAPIAEPKQTSLGKDILVGILVAVAVVGLVLGGKFLLKPGKGVVALTVFPPRQATVYLDGREAGRVEQGSALLLKDIPKGTHQLLVRADDNEAQQTVEVVAGDTVPVSVQLGAGSATAQGNAQGNAVLRLRIPPGVFVSVNGVMVKESDILKGYLVPAGVQQNVTVKKAGKQPVNFQVSLSAGQEYDRAIEMQEGRGKLVVNTTPSGADVLVNGRSYGKSPVTIEDLDPTKTFKVVLKKRGHGTVNRLLSFGDTFEQTLDVDLSGSSKDKDKASEGGSKEDEKVAQQSSTKTGDKTDGASSSHGEKEGYLLAMTQPFAKVFIDDKDTGKMTPISQRDRIPLKPGKHKVTFVTSSKRVHFDVVIRAGAEEKLIRNLNEE
ncbi:MAG TPA: serine/threonine-protein kinase [Pseudomonadota bacterium]|nr:serine/threonine-protein kinase [Pseudomonadota bacterium]